MILLDFAEIVGTILFGMWIKRFGILDVKNVDGILVKTENINK